MKVDSEKNWEFLSILILFLNKSLITLVHPVGLILYIYTIFNAEREVLLATGMKMICTGRCAGESYPPQITRVCADECRRFSVD